MVNVLLLIGSPRLFLESDQPEATGVKIFPSRFSKDWSTATISPASSLSLSLLPVLALKYCFGFSLHFERLFHVAYGAEEIRGL